MARRTARRRSILHDASSAARFRKCLCRSLRRAGACSLPHVRCRADASLLFMSIADEAPVPRIAYIRACQEHSSSISEHCSFHAKAELSGG